MSAIGFTSRPAAKRQPEAPPPPVVTSTSPLAEKSLIVFRNGAYDISLTLTARDFGRIKIPMIDEVLVVLRELGHNVHDGHEMFTEVHGRLCLRWDGAQRDGLNITINGIRFNAPGFDPKRDQQRVFEALFNALYAGNVRRWAIHTLLTEELQRYKAKAPK